MAKLLAVGVIKPIGLGVILTLISFHEVNSQSGPITPLPCISSHAVSVLNEGPEGSTVKGVLEFRQHPGSNVVSITGEIYGFEPNTEHGFHIHESGDFRNAQNPCLSAGPDLTVTDHGGHEDSVRHIGNLGDLYSDHNGVARIDIQDSLISLCGPLSIVGRAVVVHARGYSKITGNYGLRVACGIIGTIYEKPSGY